ncbi:hypothetical protein OUY22_31260 [Nonomuraea sp. MCN248]|uniref:Uncharacterized protein n=1 Tax=Nonomuraea corallina TaxID=2989783 RepID=A0ABT4SLU1_9ACTN|nr:hypothetical protein [Nonomuraea corallina]MDA0637910.1 hypothetical protein [Nonomuraea corallina]
MTNGVRHVLGLVAGLILPPLILLALLYGTAEFTLSAQRFFAVSWTALGVLLAAAAGLAVLAASRLSPLASLLGGLQYTVLGLLPVLELTGLRILPRDWLPRPLSAGYMNLGYLGFLLLLGVLLLVASAFPARWRGRPAPSAPYHPGTSSGPQPHLDQQPPDPYAREPWRGDDVTRPMRRD